MALVHVSEFLILDMNVKQKQGFLLTNNLNFSVFLK